MKGKQRCRLHGGKATGPPLGTQSALKTGLHTRQAIAARKAANAAKHLVKQQVERSIDGARYLRRKLKQKPPAALTVYPPQTKAAVEATMAKAKLLGLIIDRQEVGSPQDYEFEKARTREELLNMLHERLGPTAVERFKKFVSEIKEIPAIEDRSNGND